MIPPPMIRGNKMTDREKTILNFMTNLHISREEAEQLLEDDAHNYIGKEGERMTASAKQTQHREQSDNKTERKPKTRKIDDDKKFIFDSLKNAIDSMAYDNIITDVTSKTETEINFVYNNASYTCKLTKHKPPKNNSCS